MIFFENRYPLRGIMQSTHEAQEQIPIPHPSNLF